MIDLETLGVDHDSVILSIGMVKFNPFNNGIIDKIEIKPTIDDQTEIYGRMVDDSTIQWWATQSEDAVNQAMSDEGRFPFKDCMEAVFQYCWNQERVWANGSAFDIVILEHSLKQTLTDRPNPIPWPYYTVRDTRTIYEITGVSLRDKKYKTKTTHSAVEDAEHQVIVLQDAYHKLVNAGVLVNGY